MQIHSDYDIIKTIFSLRNDTLKKIPINLILYTVMFLIAGLLVISASCQSHQAVMSIPIPVHFTGEYSQSTGLKRTNNTMGHKKGDERICRA